MSPENGAGVGCAPPVKLPAIAPNTSLPSPGRGSSGSRSRASSRAKDGGPTVGRALSPKTAATADASAESSPGAGDERDFRRQLDDLIDVVPGPVGTSAAWARWRRRAHMLFTDAVDARTRELRERIEELERAR